MPALTWKMLPVLEGKPQQQQGKKTGNIVSTAWKQKVSAGASLASSLSLEP